MVIYFYKKVNSTALKSGNSWQNLIKHHSANNLIIPLRPQETHYLHTTRTSCQLPASPAAGKKEGEATDVTASPFTCSIQVP